MRCYRKSDPHPSLIMPVEGPSSGAHRARGYAPERERTYHVSIVIGPEVSAWVARDMHDPQALALAWGAGAEALHHPDLPQHPRSVTYVSLPQLSTLVPDGAIEPGTSADHLKLVHGRIPAVAVREQPVEPLGAQCLYVNEAEHERRILDRYAFARSLPLQAVLVNSARERSENGPVLVVHRGEERIDVAIADRNALLLSASYPARTPSDVLYFCLLATEQTEHSPTTMAVRMGGTHITRADRDLLSRYFSDAAPAWPWPQSQLFPAGMEPERWLAAFDQFTCVS